MKNKIIKYFIESWNGNEKIWKLFWIHFILIGNTLSYTTYLCWSNFVLKNRLNKQPFDIYSYLTIVFFILVFLYLIWILVAFWKSCEKLKSKNIKYLLRAILMIFLVLNLINNFIKNDTEYHYEDKFEINDDNAFWGNHRLPTQSEWNNIEIGILKDQINSIIDLTPEKTIYDDGAELWQYYSVPVKKSDNILEALKGEKIYNLYFDKNKCLEKKEITIE